MLNVTHQRNGTDRRGHYGRLRWQSKHRVQRMLARLVSGVTLIALAALLSGCHTAPTVPCSPPEPPTMPALSQPLPSETYSISAEKNIRLWQMMLDGTLVTSKPSLKVGRDK